MEINHSTIKESNRKRIIKLLLNKNEITKLDISRALDISVTTVSTNINELKELNIVEDVRSLESTGGRKATSIKIDENCRYSVGVAITGHHIKVSLVNLKGEIIDNVKVRHSNASMDKLVAMIKDIYNELINKYDIPNEKILGLGVSIPGLVNSDEGIIKSCYFLGVKDYNIKEQLKDLNVQVFIDNEANLSAFYEFINKKQITDSLLYVSITDGLGLGIIIDGKIYRGSCNASGEMGHMKIVVGGKKCRCGTNGCLEAYVSKINLLEDYNSKTNSNLSQIPEFEKLCNSFDKDAEDVMKNYINLLGIGISNLIMILDPKDIIIGGDINSLLLPRIEEIKGVVKDNTHYINEVSQDVNISIANFTESYLLGAAMVPIEEFLEVK